MNICTYLHPIPHKWTHAYTPTHAHIISMNMCTPKPHMYKHVHTHPTQIRVRPHIQSICTHQYPTNMYKCMCVCTHTHTVHTPHAPRSGTPPLLLSRLCSEACPGVAGSPVGWGAAARPPDRTWPQAFVMAAVLFPSPARGLLSVTSGAPPAGSFSAHGLWWSCPGLCHKGPDLADGPGRRALRPGPGCSPLGKPRQSLLCLFVFYGHKSNACLL